MRRVVGLTHVQLVQRLGWPRDTLLHYEHGRRAISVGRLAAIAAALDLLPAALLIEDEAVADLFVRLLPRRSHARKWSSFSAPLQR